MEDIARVDKVHAQPAIAIVMRGGKRRRQRANAVSDEGAGGGGGGDEGETVTKEAVGQEFVFVEMLDREYVLEKFATLLATVKQRQRVRKVELRLNFMVLFFATKEEVYTECY